MRFAENLGIQHNGAPKPNTTNAEGHPAFRESLKASIARVAFTGVLADSFYGKEQAQAKELIPLCMDAANKEPRFLLNAALVSRKANFKLFPKLAVAGLLSTCGAEAWAKVEAPIIELLQGYSAGQLLELALVLKAKEFGKGLGSRAQRILGAALTTRTTKRLEDMTLSDRSDMRRLLRLLHPKGFKTDQAALLAYTLGDDPKPVTERQEAMSRLATAEQQAGLISQFALPFNATKGVANKDKATWGAIRDNMSPLQVLLNLKALDERGVMNPAILERILGAVDISKTRLVPHDILRPLGMACEMSGQHVTRYREILTNLLARLASVPLPGLGDKRVGVLLDFSGSMASGYNRNSLGHWVLAVTLATPIMAACPNRYLAFFGFQACFEGERLPGQLGAWGNHDGVSFPYLGGCPAEVGFHNLLGLQPNQGTDIPKGIELFHKNNIPLDVLFLFTDEQQNGQTQGGQAWNKYRGQINPRARLVVVNVSNEKWHMAAETDPSITIIQSITPLVFQQFANFDQSAVEMIENWEA